VVWRGGITAKNYWAPVVGLRGADGYDYLKNTVKVPRQIFIVARESREFRDEPYKTIAKEKGFESAVEAIVKDAQKDGYDFEWEVLNEPKFENMDSFMSEVWNPTVRTIRRVNPEAKIHGPSCSMVNSILKRCYQKLFDFLDRADKSDTLSTIVNWHFQDGYDIAKAHGQLATEIREFYRARGRNDSLVALAFADAGHSKIRALVGLRDGIKNPTNAKISFQHLSQLPGLTKGVAAGIKVAIWDNPQTEQGVDLIPRRLRA
jgi:hypothetical protein